MAQGLLDKSYQFMYNETNTKSGYILKGSLGLFVYENLRCSNELFLSSDGELDINSGYVKVLTGLFAMKSNILHLAKFSFSDQ